MVFTSTSWKRGLAGVFASILAGWWILFWWAIRDPRPRIPRVVFMLGVIGGLFLGGLGAGLYCEATDCSRGFDALALLPFGALFGAFLGGAIGHAVAGRIAVRAHGSRPNHPLGGSPP